MQINYLFTNYSIGIIIQLNEGGIEMKKFIALLLVATMYLVLTTPITVLASSLNNIKTDEYVTYEYIDTGKQVVITLTNISKVDISMTVHTNYHDSKGNKIPTYSKDIVTFEAGRTAIIAFDNPEGYKGFEVDVYVSTDYYLKGTSIIDKLNQSIFYYDVFRIMIVSEENTSSYVAKLISLSIVYYKNGKIVGVVEKTANDLQPWNTLIVWELDNFNYDDFKININEAYY